MTEQRFSKVFWKIYDAAATKPRYISNRGGTRSGKTYSTLQFLHLLIPRADKAGDVTSVVSETLPHVKRGAVRDFERILGHPLKADPNWNATDLVYTYPNGAKLEFFSADSPDKVLGPSRKRLFINECNHVSYETARQLFVRTTGIIFLDYNPAAVFWVMDKVELKKNCVRIDSTYKDNDFLTPEQVAEIESNQNDPNWWKVYGLGEVGSLEGLIYPAFEPVNDMPEGTSFVSLFGMDFGFTNDPTTLVHLLVDTGRKEVWLDERLFRTRMTNGDISEFLRSEGLKRTDPVYADCAEPKSIEEIRRSGFDIRACSKNAPPRSEKLKFQLQWMQGWKYKVTKTSLNLIKELRNYAWAKDADGNTLNYPNDKGGVHYDHCLDAVRYALWTHVGEGGAKGDYRISIR